MKKVTNAERKARVILKEAYLDRLNYPKSEVAVEVFIHYLQFFRELFPKTDTDRLTLRWYNEWYKKGGRFN